MEGAEVGRQTGRIWNCSHAPATSLPRNIRYAPARTPPVPVSSVLGGAKVATAEHVLPTPLPPIRSLHKPPNDETRAYLRPPATTMLHGSWVQKPPSLREL